MLLGTIITILISVVILAVGIFLVSKFQLWFIRHRLLIISVFMVLGIIIYTIGYLTKDPMDYISTAFMAIFSAGRMFVLENDISSFETNVKDIPYYNITFGFIMTFSMLTTAMIVLSFLGYRVMSKIQLRFIIILFRKANLYVFTGLNQKALTLANDIKKQNKKSIIIMCVDDVNESDEARKMEEKASERGYLIYPVSQKAHINKLCLKFKKNLVKIFAINEDDNENIFFSDKYSQYLQKAKKPNPNVSLYTFIKNNEYEEIFYEEQFSRMNLHVVEEYDLASRQLFNKYTLFSSLGASDTLTVCVVGFSEISENLYKNISFLGQCEGIKLKLVAIDEDIEDKTAKFIQKNPEINKCIEFIPENFKLNSKPFFDYFNKNIQKMNCIIIAKDNIDVVTELSRICAHREHKISLCSYVQHYEKFRLLYQTHLLKNVITFGSEKDIFTQDIVINETLDQLAKGFNDYYNATYNMNKKWDELSLFEKQSNRALALHVQSKLYLMGLKCVKNGRIELFEARIEDETAFERLSMGEHLRWNAYHYVNGWRTMTNLEAQVKNKNEALKMHSCLVGWNELDKVSERFKTDYKKPDRELVRNIGNILRSVNYGVESI